MKRERIDAAIHAMLDRRLALLRDVVRSGGADRWSHLFSHGHHFATVRSAVTAGYLKADGCHYEITEAGTQYVDEIDVQRLRELA